MEDEPAILDMTRQMLEAFGYRVLSASTPGEAIRVAREHAGRIHLLITDIVMPETNGRDLAREIFAGTAPKYRETAGLIRKYYILSKDGETAGGAYLWQSQADAEKLYTEEWKAFIHGKYGAEPTVVYFDSPVVVDNAVGKSRRMPRRQIMRGAWLKGR